MRWEAKPPVRLTEWHRVFVWWPLLVDGTWVWLETVERKESDFYDYTWLYRLLDVYY